jgi:hypothetical protein
VAFFDVFTFAFKIKNPTLSQKREKDGAPGLPTITSYWQDSETMRTSVTFKCPCSVLLFFMPLS